MIQTERGIRLSDDLSSDKFRLVFPELRSLEILCREVPFPGVSTNPQEVSNSINSIVFNGSKVRYDPLSVTFKIDRDMRVFREIYKWIKDANSPQDFVGAERFQDDTGKRRVSVDASLFSLTNNFNPNIEFVFRDIFPVSLETFQANLGESNVVFGNATFNYDFYDIRDKDET